MHGHFNFKRDHGERAEHGHGHDMRHRFMRGGFGHPHARGRHGRGGGRFFDQGDLRLVMLSILAEAPGHGYQLIKTLEERTGGAYAPSPGVVYPTLTMLEEQGLIEQAGADGAKKLYTVTDGGLAELEANKTTVKAILDRLQETGQRGAGVSPRLMRAQDNLRSALKTRLMQGPLTPEQVDAIVAALEAAARSIDEA